MKRQWPAPAKLNLFLYVIGRRPDGYHLLQTLFQFLDYCDNISITPTADGKIRLFTSMIGVAHDNNLIVRAARLLQCHCWPKHVSQAPGADIYLDKILPIGGGLGGGSSDAATVLAALNQLWKCWLRVDTLAKLGLTLGSDIPVFVYGQAAFAEGIGEILTPTKPANKWYLVAIPPVSVFTQTIFSDPELKRDSPNRSLTQLLAMPFYNTCEPIVRKHFPIVEQYLSQMSKYAPSRLTGTGACIFAEFNTEDAARQVLLQVPTWMRCFIARGINFSPLYRVISLTR